MPALLAPAYAAVQLAHALASPRKVLVIHSHTNTLTGNALGLALAAQSSPDFLPVFLGQRSASVGFEIPTWRSKGRIARLVRQRADIVAFTGYVRSKRAGSSHSLRLFLWHGMPIKGIGKFDPFTADRASEPCDLAIATSQHTLGIMSQSFGIAPEKFLISGEPKTDEMPTDRPGWAWCASLRQQYRTIIGYFPTWREAVAKIDGRLRRRNDDSALGQLIGQLTADQALRHLLERHRAAMVIRVHSLSVGKLPPPSPPFFSMNEAHGEATHLLQECDVVVGDYSSVMIDALLFDRPLALWCEDLERYTAERPLPYFDFRTMFGWAFKSTLSELRDWLAARLASQPLSASEADGFARARALFHQHPRGGAGARVLAALRERLKQPGSP